MTAQPDYAPALFRRIHVMSERMDALYTALHFALILVFVALMVALYVIREDILKAVNNGKSI